MAHRIQSDPKISGFPGQMLGGYLAGLVAAEQAACVTLKRPVVAGSELVVDGADVSYDGEIVATVTEWDPDDIVVPPAVTPDELTGPAAFDSAEHPVPACYVCGPAGAGLRLDLRVPSGRPVVAARWRPAGEVTPALVWAALDCPAFWALRHDVPTGTHVVSHTLRGAIHRPVVSGEEYILVGAPLGQERRTTKVTAAVFDTAGVLHAVVDQTLFSTTWGFPLSAVTG